MSGPLKLKIKLKPKPQESETASGRSDHKRKLEEYSPQASGLLSSAASTEAKRSKKHKHNQQAPSQLQPTSSGNKVKLHIKGPWNKPNTALDQKAFTPGHSSLRPAQPEHSLNKATPSTSSLVVKQRPPAKAVQLPGLAQGAASTKKKQKGSANAHRLASLQSDAALDPQARVAAPNSAAAPALHQQSAAAAQTQPSIRPSSQTEGNGAPALPTRAILERVVDKMQRKDTFSIFKNPVTEAMAPGYFQVVKRGMDFTTLRSNVQSDFYSSWDQFQEDMDVMFDNAMAYNTPETVYHKQARSLKAVAAKMIELAKQGVTDFRGKTMQESRAHNAQIAAEAQAYREEQRGAKAASLATTAAEQPVSVSAGMTLRHASTAAEMHAAEAAGHAAKAAPRVHRHVVRESDMRKFAGQEEQNNRATYWQIPQAQYYSRWKGLAAGATAESVALHAGRPIMRPVVLLGRDTYARSIARFTAGLKGKFKVLAEAKAAPAMFPKHSQLAQTVQPSQLSTPSAPGVVGGMTTAAASSSGLVRSTLPYSSAQAGAHGSLAAGSVVAPHGTASSQNVAVAPTAAPAAARPVPASYGMIPPPAASYPSRPVQHHV